MRKCRVCTNPEIIPFPKGRAICNSCKNAKQRELHHKNKAARNAKVREWRRNNPDKFLAQQKRVDPVKRKQYQRNWERSTPAKQILERAKKRSKIKNLPFDLTIEDIIIPKFCPVLGLELKVSDSGRMQNESPSLDRIVPELGYVKDNVRVISWKANRLKCDATLAELEAIVKYLQSLLNAT